MTSFYSYNKLNHFIEMIENIKSNTSYEQKYYEIAEQCKKYAVDNNKLKHK